MLSCYHPLKGFVIGKTDSGKRKLKICSYDVDHVELSVNGTWNTIPTHQAYGPIVVRDFIELPCGQCLGCRIDYSRQWANRCMLELPYHESSYFLTLTYDEAHVPISFFGDRETGEAQPVLTLQKKDLQDFFKRFRKNTGQKVRYFACGEYGAETLRPHYHVILFGARFDDLEFYRMSKLGYKYYNSPTLDSCWKQGHAVIGEVSWETCAYTARYILKKQKGPAAAVYDEYNIEPEFTLMSRKPGIARQWYEDHPDLYESDYINVATQKGGKQFPPPRYFDKLFDAEDHEAMELIRNKRREAAEHTRDVKLAHTDLEFLDVLEIEERAKGNALRKLFRNYEKGDL